MKQSAYKLCFALIFYFITLSTHAQYWVSTQAGTGAPGFVNGHVSVAQFNKPFGLCRDAAGYLYVSDATNNSIRRITPGDTVYTLAGTGVAGWLDTIASAARFRNPADVCVDAAGNVFVADFENQRIRKIDTGGNVTTVAGTGIAGYKDGAGDSAMFNYPRGIVADAAGNLYVGDSWNHRIRKIAPDGTVSTLAGGGTAIGVGSIGDLMDGADTTARFYTPCGLSIDSDGNIYVADAYNHRIRKITPAGEVSTVSGTGSTGTTAGGFVDGPFGTAMLDTPTEVFWHASTKSLFIGDTFNHAVRQTDSTGYTFTLAGTGAAGNVEGSGSTAQFNFARGVTATAYGDTVWLCDYNNNKIRKIARVAMWTASISEKMSFTVWPQPAQDVIYFPWPGEAQHISFSVTDVRGATCMNGELTQTDNPEIVTSALLPGIYLLRMIAGDKQIAGRITILR